MRETQTKEKPTRFWAAAARCCGLFPARKISELEPILEDFAERENIRIEMTYQGSLDIMRLLGEEEIPYDAVWPASSLWLSVGDTGHRIKHAESISITPVVFGIRKAWRRSWALQGARCRSTTCFRLSRAGSSASA